MDEEFQALVDFVTDRIRQGKSLPTLTTAADQILSMATEFYAVDNIDGAYACGYADAAEDALRAISGVWRYHPDYQGWADDHSPEDD